jgi:hypothetical protein
VTLHAITPGVFCPAGGVTSELEVITNATGAAFTPNPEAFDIWLGN